MKKRIPIKYSQERVVLSDVLPYETPLIFSNRYYYNYLVKRRKLWGTDKILPEIERILFNSENGQITIPFKFRIAHKNDDFRELNVIHPSSQLRVVRFYEKYDNLILYYSSISPFSIRKPSKVAKFTYFNDKLHSKTNDGDLKHSQIEQDDSEYENLKSYFSYQKYSNIHKFFESYHFHRCEKKYNKLLMLDISKCFDSIYSHTISWALLNKNIVKDNIDDSRTTFPGHFDELMQKLNANETNGIVIGPEFSRVFSELIFQSIDKNIENRLKFEDEKKLIHKVDYEIFRYVDDFFIFFNEEEDKDQIVKQVRLALKEYKMYLSETKNELYEKPIITSISYAKQKISDLFNEHLILKSKEDTSNETKDDIPYFSSNAVITRFKSIIKESEIPYKDIMNYALAVLDKKTSNLIQKFKNIENAEVVKTEKQFEKGFLEILDVAFFLYSVSPRVNSTIKICLVLNKIISFLKRNNSNNYIEPFSYSSKHNILKKISDEINQILKKNKYSVETPIETMYLLIALSQLGREYRLNVNVLCDYLNINKNGVELKSKKKLNYFNITVILFYIKDIKTYLPLKELVKKQVLEWFSNVDTKSWNRETESVLLLMDILTCPFLNMKVSKSRIDKINSARQRKSKNLKKYIKQAKLEKYEFKKKVLDLLDLKDNQIKLIESERYWFTKWTDFDFGLELQSKRSQEVY